MHIILDLNLIPFLVVYFMIIILITAVDVYHKIKKRNKYTLLYKYLVGLYFLILIKVTLLGTEICTDEKVFQFMVSQGLYRRSFVQLIPFKSIIDVLSCPETLSVTYIQIIGNIMLIAPIALMMNYVYQISLCKVVIYCMVIITGIETLQLAIDLITKLPSHVFDIDDFILNGSGILIGLGTSSLIKKSRRIDVIIRHLCFEHDITDQHPSLFKPHV